MGMGMGIVSLPESQKAWQDDDVGKSPGKTNRIPEAEKGQTWEGEEVLRM